MIGITGKHIGLLMVLLLAAAGVFAQADATVSAKADANQITVGDQVRVFIEAQHNASQSRLEWAAIPDSFNSLEIVERGKIDTARQGDIITYKQRLLVTGFDSGVFVIPAFSFPIIPNGGNAYMVKTDSFPILVQTVEVDTTKGFRGIKDIMQVKSTWMDYIWYIAGGALFLILAAFVIVYFIRNKRIAAPAAPPPQKVETLQEQALRMLAALEQKHLWQKNRVKEYYSELTDILRSYIEARFNTPALELTTDELLTNARMHKEMAKHTQLLSSILYTADLAKFAKAEPTPEEHAVAMENAVQFIHATKPTVTETPAQS